MISSLAAAGCVAPDEEAAMLLEAAAGNRDELTAMLARRVTGEPIEWIVGWAPFCGLRLHIGAPAYVPRVQTEVLAERAAAVACELITGVALDVAAGCGAIAAVIQRAAPGFRVVGTELDPVAAGWARRNGVDARVGDLDDPVPRELLGRVDVLCANGPYVPTASIALLPRDVQRYEPRVALDGGGDGLDFIRRVAHIAPKWLRPGGRLLVEIGPDQAEAARQVLATDSIVHYDADGDGRAVEGVY